MHANARLTVHGRKELIERICCGRPVAHVAAEMGISRATAYKWWRRWRAEGDPGLWDRSSRPHRCPQRTPRHVERRIERLRRDHKLGPARIAGIVEMHGSTVHRVLVRQGLNQLRTIDPPTGRVIRRIETSRPGELVHIDVKKLGRIPDGGGWWTHGRGNDTYKGHSSRLRLRPLRRRCVQPDRVQRDPQRRRHRVLHRVPRTRQGLVRAPRRHRSNGS